MERELVKTLIIIPAYNEEECIYATYLNIMQYNRTQRNKSNIDKFDIIVIDDGSTDNTGMICDEKGIPCIHLIHNLGIGGAVQTGYKYALENDYDIAIQFDGDGQHDINFISNLINPILNNEADFVIGSRFIEDSIAGFKSSRSRRIGIKLISLFIKHFTGIKIYDTTSGFRACNKTIIAMFAKAYPLEYPEPISTTELLRKKFRVREVGVKMNERVGGKSSIHSWKNAYYMLNVLISVFIVGTRSE